MTGTVKSRVERLEKVIGLSESERVGREFAAMTSEQKMAELRELLVMCGVSADDIATEEGLNACLKTFPMEALRLHRRNDGRIR